MNRQHTSLSGRRLLLVEDEALVALMLEEMLSSLGCVVVGTAANVTRGLAVLDDDASDLDAAVLDVNLGGEKAYPIAERLIARSVPFIFSTGYDPSGIEPGFAAVPTLSKPYGPSALEATLLAALARAASPPKPG